MQVSLELAGHPKANVKQVMLGVTTVIGRSKECQLRIASTSVSRRHCEIRMAPTTVSVVDLGSSNGTFLNSERLPAGEEFSLVEGCSLQIGSVQFIVHLKQPARKLASPEATVPPGSTVDFHRTEREELSAAELAGAVGASAAWANQHEPSSTNLEETDDADLVATRENAGASRAGGEPELQLTDDDFVDEFEEQEPFAGIDNEDAHDSNGELNFSGNDETGAYHIAAETSSGSWEGSPDPAALLSEAGDVVEEEPGFENWLTSFSPVDENSSSSATPAHIPGQEQADEGAGSQAAALSPNPAGEDVPLARPIVRSTQRSRSPAASSRETNAISGIEPVVDSGVESLSEPALDEPDQIVAHEAPYREAEPADDLILPPVDELGELAYDDQVHATEATGANDDAEHASRFDRFDSEDAELEAVDLAEAELDEVELVADEEPMEMEMGMLPADESAGQPWGGGWAAAEANIEDDLLIDAEAEEVALYHEPGEDVSFDEAPAVESLAREPASDDAHVVSQADEEDAFSFLSDEPASSGPASSDDLNDFLRNLGRE